MASPSIRRLSLADLDRDTLDELIRHGEDLLVERKRDLPRPPGFGATVGSFANTLGGWVLIGVADDGAVVGWEKPERLDLQSHLGNVLRAQVDPLPPFVADMREADGKPVAVVRVFESADSPHIVRGTGAVYLRSSKGKEPVDDHRTLLELARRGEEAERRARSRLTELPAVGFALRPPDFRPPNIAFAEETDVRFIVRAAPLTVTPALSDWPLTRRAGEALTAVAGELLPPDRMPFDYQPPTIEPFGRGITVRASQETGIDRSDTVTLIADSGGVLGIALSRGSLGDQPTVLLNAMLDTDLVPLASAVASVLSGAEAYGRAAVDLWMVLPNGGHVLDRKTSTFPRASHVARDLTAPADDDEVQALALSWHRELQRTAGILKYEGEPPAGQAG